MLKVLVACANGAGTSLMMKEKAQMALITLGINDLHIDHCDLHSCKMDDYDLIFCPVAFLSAYQTEITQKTGKFIGLKRFSFFRQTLDWL